MALSSDGWDELRAGDWERTQQGEPRASFVAAFVNIVLTLCDVMFAPYYFNSYISFWLVMMSKTHLIPMQQAFVNIVLTLCDAGDSSAPYYFNSSITFQISGVTDILVGPDEQRIHHSKLQRISDICKEAGCWLVIDNTRTSTSCTTVESTSAWREIAKVARGVIPVPKLRQISLSG